MSKFTCAVTGKTVEAKGDRMPRGWKRLADGSPCSPAGWEQRYSLRVVNLVISPSDGDWASFRSTIKAAWSESQSLAQWALDECFRRDVRRTPESPTKMPAAQKIYLYGLAKESYHRWGVWAGAYGSANCILRRAESKWRESRYAVLWTQSERPAIFSYPQPYVLDANQWKLIPPGESDDRKQWRASIAMSGGRLIANLRRGNKSNRWGDKWTEAIEALATGNAIQAEAAILRRKVVSDDHRVAGNSSENGVKSRFDYILKLVLFVPREERRDKKLKEKTLYVSTQPDCLLTILDEDRERLWSANYDHVRRWIVGYARRLQRLSEDAKADRRGRRGNMLAQERERMRIKHQNRMRDVIHQLSHQVVDYAQRRRASKIEFNDTEHGYIVEFPWFALRQAIESKAKDQMIDFSHVGVASDDVGQ